MTVRVTQQVVTVVYRPSCEARVTAVAVEVIRSVAGSAGGGGGKKPVVFVIT